jgi:hypothetical protein
MIDFEGKYQYVLKYVVNIFILFNAAQFYLAKSGAVDKIDLILSDLQIHQGMKRSKAIFQSYQFANENE